MTLDLILKDYHASPLQKLTRRLVARGLDLRHRLLHRHRVEQPVLEMVRGVPLVVLPGVFNPAMLRTGAFMAEVINTLKLEPSSVLDLGTGSGIGAVFAARRGWRVTAVDLNPEAVRCARLNAMLNHVDVTVHHGDLFAPVAGQTFDLICFNPPFYRGTPKNAPDCAWRGEAVFERFVAGLPAALTPTGQVLLILSTDGDGVDLLRRLAGAGCSLDVVARRDLLNEVLTAYLVQ